MTAKTNPRTILDRAIRTGLGKAHTVAVCRVLAYDLNGGSPKADVRPIHKYRLNTGEFVEPPTLYDVPVPPLQWGDWVIHAPLNVDDRVIVLYSERSLDEWLLNGGDRIEPEDPRRFDDKDAIVIGKIGPFADKADGLEADALSLSNRDGTSKVVLRPDGTVELGAAAADFVALAAAVDKFQTLVDSTLVGFTPVPGDGGAALKAAYATARTTAYPGGSIGTVGADKVKAE